MAESEKANMSKGFKTASVYLLSMVPAVALALFAPAKVLSAFPMVDKYTVIIRDIVPAIDRLATVSLFPELTRLVLSIEWTLVPVQVLLLFLWKTYSINLDQLHARRAYAAVALPLLLGIFLWCTAIFYDVTPSDLQGRMFSESLLRLASTSRLGLAIVTSLFVTTTAVVIGAFCNWARYIPHIYFDYQGKGQQ